MRLSENYDLKGIILDRIIYHYPTKKAYRITETQYKILKSLEHLKPEEIILMFKPSQRNNVSEYLCMLKKEGIITEKKQEIQPFLEAVHWEITSKCNLRCKHCYQGGAYVKDDMKDLELPLIFKIIDEFKKLGVMQVAISGGEPLTMPELFEILHYIESKKITVSGILTNGLLITDKTIKKIKELKSNTEIFISLDGFKPKNMILRTSKNMTGEFLISKLTKTIKKLILQEIPVTINTSVTRYNVKDLTEMYSKLKKLGVYRWRLGIPKEIGAFTETHDKYDINLEIGFEKYREIIKLYLKDLEQNKNHMKLQIESFFRLETFYDPDQNFFKEYDFVCDYDNKKRSLCIKPNGDVTPCPVLVKQVIENLRNESLTSIWHSESMKNIKNIRTKDIPECAECELAWVCGGGCRAVSYAKYNELYRKDDVACASSKFLLEKIIPILKEYKLLNKVKK